MPSIKAGLSQALRPVEGGYFVLERRGSDWVKADFFEEQTEALRHYPGARVVPIEPDLPPDIRVAPADS